MIIFKKLVDEVRHRSALDNAGTLVKAFIAMIGVWLVHQQNNTAVKLAQGQSALTERLQRQNMETESARAGYRDIADIILNAESPVHAQIAALRLFPSAWRSSVIGPESQRGKRSYPVARTLKLILTEYVRRPRGDDQMSADPGMNLEDLSTKILVLLHKLGPSEKSHVSLWNFPPEDQGYSDGRAPSPRGELEGSPHQIDLSHIDTKLFTGINLPNLLRSQDAIVVFPEGANFGRANLRGANLRNSILKGAKFPQADLRGADFRGAILDGADFTNSNREGTLFDPNISPGEK